jgi:hypothetical protein
MCIIMLETTGDLTYLPPLAIAAISAQWVGNTLNHGKLTVAAAPPCSSPPAEKKNNSSDCPVSCPVFLSASSSSSGLYHMLMQLQGVPFLSSEPTVEQGVTKVGAIMQGGGRLVAFELETTVAHVKTVLW